MLMRTEEGKPKQQLRQMLALTKALHSNKQISEELYEKLLAFFTGIYLEQAITRPVEDRIGDWNRHLYPRLDRYIGRVTERLL